MKKINKLYILFAFLFMLAGCQNDDHSFGDINAPKDLELKFVIQGKDTENPDGDGSGIVQFTATATNAISYRYIFSDGDDKNSPTGTLTKRFTKTGTNVYSVTVIASGTGGVTSSVTENITVYSDFTDAQAVEWLTGGSSKKWYVAADEKGHLGVGPNNDDAGVNWKPEYYSANPFEKSEVGPCLYNNEITFILDGEQLKFEQNNFGSSFFNAKYLADAGGTGSSDLCLNYNTSGQKNVLLSPTESILMTTNRDKTRGTTMTFGGNGFMAYYIKQTTYEILSITENRMEVRALMGDDPSLAWYMIFTTNKPVQGGGTGPGEDFDNLVWSDEFDVDGVPDPTKWKYDLGTGTNGWGNQELQSYTNTAANSKVQGGKLIITAKKEVIGTSQYSSARLKSEGLYDFKYGKVEFSAKLPTGGGTWPALWMLGSNYQTNTWPACGEIDIMEHKGNFPNIIHGTLHYPSANPAFSANNTATKTITNASTEFHKYSMIWTATSIKIYVDDMLYHSVANNSTLPFNANFFLIMNVAMGGTFGGAVASDFSQSSMEVEYVRVYQ